MLPLHRVLLPPEGGRCRLTSHGCAHLLGIVHGQAYTGDGVVARGATGAAEPDEGLNGALCISQGFADLACGVAGLGCQITVVCLCQGAMPSVLQKRREF